MFKKIIIIFCCKFRANNRIIFSMNRNSSNSPSKNHCETYLAILSVNFIIKKGGVTERYHNG